MQLYDIILFPSRLTVCKYIANEILFIFANDYKKKMSPRICLDLYMSRIRLKSKIAQDVKYILLQMICMFRNYHWNGRAIEHIYHCILSDFAEAVMLAKSLLC